MKRSHIKSFFAAGLFVVMMLPARAGQPEYAIYHLVQSVSAELPDGWTASYDEEFSCLEVARDKPVLVLTIVDNLGPDESRTPQWEPFEYSFHIMPLVPLQNITAYWKN